MIALATCTVFAASLWHFGVSAYTWPDPQAEKLDDIMYGGVLDFFIESCQPEPNNKNVAAEWVRFAYHDAATHNVSDGTGGIDASLFFELGRPENVGSGMAESAQQFLSVTSRYASRSDVVAAALVLAVSECRGPQIPFRSGRIDAQVAGPFGVPQPQDSLDSLTSAFHRQGFSQSEMIGLVACGHTVGGIRNPDFPTVVTPFSNGTQHIVPFNTNPHFSNSIVTDYLNSTTPNLLVISPNHTMTSDLRVFSSDGNVTMEGLTSPSIFSDTCASLLERLANTVPSNVVLGDVIAPLEDRVQNFQIVPLDQDRLQASFQLRLLNRPSPNVSVTMLWDAQGQPCSSCLAPAFRVVADPTNQLTTLGYNPASALFTSVIINATAPPTKFWFEIKNEGSEPTVVDNGGGGYPISTTNFLFLDNLVTTNTNSAGEFVSANVSVAIPAGMNVSNLYGQAFQMSPTAADNTSYPFPPINNTVEMVVDTWSHPIPGWTIYTGNTPMMAGSGMDFDFFATVNGTDVSILGKTAS